MKKQQVSPIFIGAFCAFFLGACSSQSPSPLESTQSIEAAKFLPLGEDEVLSRIGVLAPRDMDAGRCAMFLWFKREDAPLVFFQQSDGSAFASVDGAETALSLVSSERQITQEFYEVQRFQAGSLALELTVKPEQRRSLQDGLKLPSGQLFLETSDGWSATLPVGGVIGCR